MIINFISNFNKGYVGEIGDATHLVRELRNLGHKVNEVHQDIYKAYVDGESPQVDWAEKLPSPHADLNIITKWHAFDKRVYVDFVREQTKAPVFYWVWDYMDYNGIPDWHREMVDAADLYLGNDVRLGKIYELHPKNAYYFPMDVCDGDLPEYIYPDWNKKYDVTFFGSYLDQGERIEYLRKINKEHSVKIFSWNYEEWKKEGFDASPAVYGVDFNRRVGESRIILGFSVEPNCWGYWSNRVGKVLVAGGFLLYQYAPGMELFLGDGVEYFSSIKEANEKIWYYLIHKEEREKIRHKGHAIGRSRFTSEQRAKELMILAERFIKTQGEDWKI